VRFYDKSGIRSKNKTKQIKELFHRTDNKEMKFSRIRREAPSFHDHCQTRLPEPLEEALKGHSLLGTQKF
jgi:hypothetical protein